MFMFGRFTERAQQVLVLAQDEARRLNHNFIGTEHLLLGLVKEGAGGLPPVYYRMQALILTGCGRKWRRSSPRERRPFPNQ